MGEIEMKVSEQRNDIAINKECSILINVTLRNVRFNFFTSKFVWSQYHTVEFILTVSFIKYKKHVNSIPFKTLKVTFVSQKILQE